MLKDPKLWGMIIVGGLVAIILANKVLTKVPMLGKLLAPAA